MASEENELLIQETPLTNEKTTGRGKNRKWSEAETDQLIDLLEQKTCLWDVGTKEYHLKNKWEKAYEEMRDAVDIDNEHPLSSIVLHSMFSGSLERLYTPAIITQQCLVLVQWTCLVRLHAAERGPRSSF